MLTSLNNNQSFDILDSCEKLKSLCFDESVFHCCTDWFSFLEAEFRSKKCGDETAGIRIYLFPEDDKDTGTVAVPTTIQVKSRFGLPLRVLRSLSGDLGDTWDYLVLSEKNKDLKDLTRKFEILLERADFDQIEFTPFVRNTIELEALLNAAKSKSWPIKLTKFHAKDRYQTINTSFSDYIKNRKHKKQVKRFFNKKGTRMDMVRSSENLEQAIKDINTVGMQSWKAEQDPDGARQDLVRLERLIRMAANRGELRIATAYIDDKPIGTTAIFVSQETAFLNYIAYSSQHRNLSAGTNVMVAMLEEVIDQDNVLEIDFDTGDEPYKELWADESRDTFQITGFNPNTWVGRLGVLLNIYLYPSIHFMADSFSLVRTKLLRKNIRA